MQACNSCDSEYKGNDNEKVNLYSIRINIRYNNSYEAISHHDKIMNSGTYTELRFEYTDSHGIILYISEIKYRNHMVSSGREAPHQ